MLDMAGEHKELERRLFGRGKKGTGMRTLMLSHLDVRENQWTTRSPAFKNLKKELATYLHLERWKELGVEVRHMCDIMHPFRIYMRLRVLNLN
jgi:hypothetical protein